MLNPFAVVGEEHYDVARERPAAPCSATRRCRTSSRSSRKIERFFSQPFSVAEIFTGSPGIQVPLADTIKGFKGLVNGDYDDLPEAAFYMVGTIEDAKEKAKKIAAAA